MGHTVEITQHRSFTGEEWAHILPILKNLPSNFDIEIGDDRITHSPHESWMIYKDISEVTSQYLKPGHVQDDIYVLQSLIELYAPGIYSLGDKNRVILSSVSHLLSSANIQYIQLQDKVIYSIDGRSLSEFAIGDDYKDIIDIFIR